MRTGFVETSLLSPPRTWYQAAGDTPGKAVVWVGVLGFHVLQWALVLLCSPRLVSSFSRAYDLRGARRLAREGALAV